MNTTLAINSVGPTFTAFAGKGIIVITRRPVPTDEAQLFLLTRRWSLLLLGVAAVKTVSIKTALRRQVLSTCNKKIVKYNINIDEEPRDREEWRLLGCYAVWLL
jgi:hypothetical protein